MESCGRQIADSRLSENKKDKREAVEGEYS